MSFYTGNRYLNIQEMTVNANYIMNAFLSRGWTKNAIAGMLGNMHSESTINPGIWQSLNQGNLSGGYGLVQWTPASNYLNWATSRGLEPSHIDSNIARIVYELENGLQYYATPEYNLSFYAFTQSNQTPEWLASAFLKNYERAGVEVEQQRRTQARYWYDRLDGSGGGVGRRPHFPTTEGLRITSKYGWREVPSPSYHYAIDIGGGGVNHPIYATQDGVVIENVWHDVSGWRLRIRHTSDVFYSQYLHLASRSPMAVGTTVSWGQEIGTMGNTGYSFGIHLDFAIAITANGFFTDAGTIDPEGYLQMEFGGGSTPIEENEEQNLLHLLLSDGLNGWKY